MRIFLTIFSFFIICSFVCCNQKISELTGVYESPKYNLVNRIKFPKGLILGEKLILSKDSTFKYTTCGNTFIGNWETKEDSLFLKGTILDSLPQNKTFEYKRLRTFKINKNSLRSTFVFKDKSLIFSEIPFVLKRKNKNPH